MILVLQAVILAVAVIGKIVKEQIENSEILYDEFIAEIWLNALEVSSIDDFCECDETIKNIEGDEDE